MMHLLRWPGGRRFRLIRQYAQFTREWGRPPTLAIVAWWAWLPRASYPFPNSRLDPALGRDAWRLKPRLQRRSPPPRADDHPSGAGGAGRRPLAPRGPGRFG